MRITLPTLFRRDPMVADPFNLLRREMDEVFRDFGKRFSLPTNGEAAMLAMPVVDVAETRDAIEVTAELPGVEEKNLKVTLDRDGLTISGEKSVEREEKGKDWHVMERSEGSFRRQIGLAFEPDAGKIDASFKNGVLKVTIPKPAEAKAATKAIPVKSTA